jgi:hypothetical protein
MHRDVHVSPAFSHYLLCLLCLIFLLALIVLLSCTFFSPPLYSSLLLLTHV